MTWIYTVEQSCQDTLKQPELRDIARAIWGSGVTVNQCLGWVRAVTEVPATQQPIVDLRQTLIDRGELAESSFALERYLLLLAIRDGLDRVKNLPTGHAVHRLMGDAFAFFAAPDERSIPRMRCGGADFASMCKVATHRRFPAGQFEWEISGLPRSWFAKVPPRALPGLLKVVGLELHGRSPLIFPHFAASGPRRIVMRETEVKRSFHRMAHAMALQPRVRGFLAAAWFLSPDALLINPQLSWFLPLFQENGGFCTTLGTTELGIRQLGTNPELRARYEKGEFRPRMGMVVWPRRAMLAWAERNDEYADPANRIRQSGEGAAAGAA